MRALLADFCVRRRWLTLYPVIAFVVLAAVLKDLRWAIVAFMWLCVILPGILANVALFAVLSPDYRRAVLPRRVTLDKGPILKIEYPENPEVEAETLGPERLRGLTRTKILLRSPHAMILLPEEGSAITPLTDNEENT